MTKRNKFIAFQGQLYSHGKELKVSIDGKKMKAILYISEHTGKSFLLQDSRYGSSPQGDAHLKFGKSTSWVFSDKDTQGVVILSNSNVSFQEIKDYYNIVMADGHIFYITFVQDGSKIVETKKILFSVRPHPDCCGKKDLYGFSATTKSSKKAYYRYTKLTLEDLAQIKGLLGNKMQYIATIADWQIEAKRFIVDLGFEKIYSFINTNYRNNLIHVYTNKHVDVNTNFSK